MNVVNTFSNVVKSNKKWIEYALIAVIVLEFLPREFLGLQVKSRVHPLVSPLIAFVQHDITQFLIFLLLVWSCCVVNDSHLFTLLVIMLLVLRR